MLPGLARAIVRRARTAARAALLAVRLRPHVGLARQRPMGAPPLDGFPAGVFNPSGALEGGELLALARAERWPLTIATADRRRYLEGWAPVLLRCTPEAEVKTATVLRYQGCPPGQRAEDFRLFRDGDRVLAMHALVDVRGWREGEPADWTATPVTQQVAELDVGAGILRRVAAPSADFPLALRERNWGVFEDGGRLLILYGLEPYRVLEVEDRTTFRCRTLVVRQLPFERASGGAGPLSLSTGPILWDADHHLALFHQRDPHGVYAHWALLLDRRTLLPVRVTRRPLFRGRFRPRRRPAGVLYTTGVLPRGDGFLFLSGIEDRWPARCTVGRAELDRLLVELPGGGRGRRKPTGGILRRP